MWTFKMCKFKGQMTFQQTATHNMTHLLGDYQAGQ